MTSPGDRRCVQPYHVTVLVSTTELTGLTSRSIAAYTPLNPHTIEQHAELHSSSVHTYALLQNTQSLRDVVDTAVLPDAPVVTGSHTRGVHDADG